MLIDLPAQSGDSIEAVARQISYVALRSGRPDHYIAVLALAAVRIASHKVSHSEFYGFDDVARDEVATAADDRIVIPQTANPP